MEDELTYTVVGRICLSRWCTEVLNYVKEELLCSQLQDSFQSSLWDTCVLVVLFISEPSVNAPLAHKDREGDLRRSGLSSSFRIGLCI